jgi:hypothetical protein
MQSGQLNRALISTLGMMLAGMTLFTGCNPGGHQEVIDLNKVLAIFDQTIKSESAEPSDPSENLDPAEKLDPSKPEEPEVTKEILTKFADNLNAAKLVKAHIAVELAQSGAIQGFADSNKDGKRGSNEKALFDIEFDPAGNRVIASQKVASRTYRRDHYYSSSYGRYYYYRSMHRSMWGRQNRYYGSGYTRGTSGQTRPNYQSMSMSPTSYHSQAKSQASQSRSSSKPSSSRSSSSARGYGGSRSFSSGK